MSSAAPSLATTELPTALYRAEQSRLLDRCAIDTHGIAGIYLMKRAGRATFEALLERWPALQALTVLAGAGNNAGDGYVIAALAAQRCIPVTVYYLAEPARLQGDAALACDFARREGVTLRAWDDTAELRGVVVDALLGTGTQGDVRPAYAAAIESINAAGLPVVAVDMPSGLCADTGRSLGAAVEADLTVTFIALKQGLLTGRGPALCGELRFADLGVPAAIYATQPAASQRLSLAALLAQLPPRQRDAHKGDFGHVLVVGGDAGFAGAALMAAEAAARSGAGLTSVATHAAHVAALVARRPELMVHAVSSGQTLAPLLARPTVLVIGPGLGQSPWSEQLLQAAAASELPQVLDADALNLLAEGRVIAADARANRVLTPHPGEAARLLGCSVAAVQADRFAAAVSLQQRFGGVVVLKGAGTLVASADGVSLAHAGNPGMASGGMGDVLSGIIGALLAQGLSPRAAAELGVMVHAMAADMAAADEGERGLLATDLLVSVRQLLNGVVS